MLRVKIFWEIEYVSLSLQPLDQSLPSPINHVNFVKSHDANFLTMYIIHAASTMKGDNMKDGLYQVSFKSNQQDFGVGIVTISNERINGGDFAYYYQGEISGDTALLKVTRFNEEATSVFGPINEFNLQLIIKPVMGYHILEGNIQGQTDMKIQIHARFLAPLVQ